MPRLVAAGTHSAVSVCVLLTTFLYSDTSRDGFAGAVFACPDRLCAFPGNKRTLQAPPCFSTGAGPFFVAARVLAPAVPLGCAETIRSVGCFRLMIDERKSHTSSWEKLAEVGIVAVVFFLFL